MYSWEGEEAEAKWQCLRPVGHCYFLGASFMHYC
jgi:hypothetical protein